MKKFLLLINTLIICMCANAQINSDLYNLLKYEMYAKALETGNIQIVDVRTPDEYKEGHIPKAINIDVSSKDFNSQISKLSKDEPVAVYCRSGKRSLEASKELVKQGYKVYDLDGGILAWKGKKETS